VINAVGSVGVYLLTMALSVLITGLPGFADSTINQSHRLSTENFALFLALTCFIFAIYAVISTEIEQINRAYD